MHKMCCICYIKRVKDPIIHTTMKTTSPIAECYSNFCLLLQRYALTLHCGEVKALYNTLQAFSKLYLSETWLPKVSIMSYEVL